MKTCSENNLEPLISVIVPVYNAEKYLRCCLDSIIGQTYRNLEIILVNDGSTDSSGEICHQYAQNDSRIRLLTQENRGVCAARNSGLDHMTGSYIVFVDSDDYISPYMVEVLLKQALTQDVLLAVCDYLEAEDSNDTVQFDKIPENGSFPHQRMGRDDIFDTMGTNQYPRFLVLWGKLYHEKIFHDLRFPLGHIYEDACVFCPIYVKAVEVCYTNFKLYAYRMSENSIIRSNGESMYDWELLMKAYLERLRQFKCYGNKKYVDALERQLFRDLISASSYMEGTEYKKFMERIEQERCRIVGGKSFPLEYILFKFSPSLYRVVRKNYLKAKHLVGSLRYKESI